MPLDYAALKNEILTDPLKLGYAARVALGDDEGVARLLNAPGPDRVAVPALARGEFLLAVAPAYLALPGLAAAVQAKWDRILAAVAAADRIDLSHPSVKALLAAAVADAVLTQAQVDAFTKRPGSRAEFLLGAGAAVTHTDVAVALRG